MKSGDLVLYFEDESMDYPVLCDRKTLPNTVENLGTSTIATSGVRVRRKNVHRRTK